MARAILVLVVLALVVVGAAVMNDRKSVAAEDGARDLEREKQQERFLALERKVAEQNQAIANLEATIAGLKTEIRARAKVDESLAQVATNSGVAMDQATFSALAKQLEVHAKALRRRGMLPPDASEIQAAKQVAVNAGITPRSRLSALRILRQWDQRSRDVVLSMIQLYQTARDPAVRADIFRQLEGTTEPELKSTLLNALQSETDTDVRDEAVETLRNYGDDPQVRAAIELIATEDPDQEVREEAQKVLRRWASQERR